jgi:branched-chain amino acid transport system permease protein
MQVLEFIITGAIGSAPYMLLAYGFVLTNEASGVFNLALGAAFISAAFAAYELAGKHHLSFGLAVIAAVVVGAVINAAIYELLIRPVIVRARSLVGMLVIAVGTVTAISYALSYASHYSALILSPTILSGDIHLGAITIPELQLAFFLLACVILAAAELGIRRTSYGLALTALSDNDELARIVGVRTRPVILIAYLFAGAAAGLAAIFLESVASITTFDGLNAIVIASIAALIGGIKNRRYALIGALFLGVVQGVSLEWVAGKWQDAVTYAVLILVIIVLPRGLAGVVMGAERR